jgi:hypothetical protein
VSRRSPATATKASRSSTATGTGAELEAEIWAWDSEAWAGAGSSGAGSLDTLGAVQADGQIGGACFAYGRAAGRRSITISFDDRRHEIPVSPDGV